MKTPPIPNDINDALALYFDNQATPEVCMAIQGWLEQDPANVSIFAQFGHIERMIYCAQKTEDASAVFALLAEMEAAAEAEIVQVEIDPDLSAQHDDPASLSIQDLTAAGQYVLSHAFIKKTAILTAAVSAAAAVLLLTFILINPFATDAPTPVAEIDFWDDHDASATQPSSVATLTNAHGATWDTSAGMVSPKTGDVLRAGDRLSLTQGFAEITTNLGAVTILQAPVTVQLIDHDNALRLDEGKLVGICETPSSQGFTVYTPKARVVDFGTRFGVEVRNNGATTASVFTGEVQLSEIATSPEQPTRDIHLTAGWASSVTHKGALQRQPKPVTAKDYASFAMSIDQAITPAFAYRRAVLASSPVLYWAFEEQGSTTRNLAGDPAMNGKAFGQTGRGQGLFGSALKLTGDLESMGGFASENPIPFADNNAYTLEAWCWVDQPHHGRVLALAELDDLGHERPNHYSAIEVLTGDEALPMIDSQNESVRFLHRNPPSASTTTGANTLSRQGVAMGQWVHLVAVNNGRDSLIYLDGELIASAEHGQAVATDRAIALYAGVSPIMLRADFSQNQSDFRPFHGRIDEVAVYDRALSQQTIRTHFSLGRVGQD